MLGAELYMFGPETYVRVSNVQVIRVSDFALWCRARGKEFYVPRNLIQGAFPGAGDTGDLLLPRWFAEDQGLTSP